MVKEASPAMYKKYSGHTTYEYMVCTGYLTFRSEPPQRPMGSGCGVALTDNWVGNDTRSGPRQFPPWRWCVAPRHSEKPMRHFPSIAAESSMVIITGNYTVLPGVHDGTGLRKAQPIPPHACSMQRINGPRPEATNLFCESFCERF